MEFTTWEELLEAQAAGVKFDFQSQDGSWEISSNIEWSFSEHPSRYRVKVKPHIHAELIKKWADGACIQFKSPVGNWIDAGKTPSWLPENEYRIKPEPKPDEIYFANTYSTTVGMFYDTKEEANRCTSGTLTGMIKVVLDGETGKLKHVEIVKD